jgi:uncharacterized protein (TIGR00369 family)
MSRRPAWGDQLAPPHIWLTLGYRNVDHGPGRVVIEWDATAEFGFPSPGGPIVHGGMVTTVLDTAMGGACWSVLEEDEEFLTADLRVEFIRAARPGTLRAEGLVIQRNRRVAFCSADLYDAEGRLLASSRGTQMIRSSNRT